MLYKRVVKNHIPGTVPRFHAHTHQLCKQFGAAVDNLEYFSTVIFDFIRVGCCAESVYRGAIS